jgi:hypothetical protein
VTKSLYAIGGMGIAACLVLSFIMHRLLEAQQTKTRPAIAHSIEDAFAAKLLAPVTAKVETVRDRRVMVISITILGGLKREHMADSVATLVWTQLAGTPEAPDDLRIVVGDDLDKQLSTFDEPKRLRPSPGAPTPAPQAIPPAPPRASAGK